MAGGAKDRSRILRLECYGNGIDEEDTEAGLKPLSEARCQCRNAKLKLYTNMRPGHLYLSGTDTPAALVGACASGARDGLSLITSSAN